MTAVVLYGLVAVVFTWPLIAHFSTHLPGSPDGDTGVYVWNQWVFQHEVLDHRTLPYFTEKIFGATGRANLSLHNYTAFANVLALPFVKILGVVATFNLVYLALTGFTAYATFLLARRVTGGDSLTAWLSGVLFAWSPVLVTRGMGHFSLVAAAPLPVFVLQLLRIHERADRRQAIFLGATVAWATACDVYLRCVLRDDGYGVPARQVIRGHSPAVGASREGRVDTAQRRSVALSVAGLLFALVVGHGWEFTFLGRLVQIRTVYTPALVLTGLMLLRGLLHFRPILHPVSVEQIGATVRTFATAALVCAILMSPLLYAFGVRVLDGRGDQSRILWRSSPPGLDALALIAPNQNHPIAPQSLREWLATLTRDGYLENVVSIPIVALVVIFLAIRTDWRPPRWLLALTIGFGLLALGPFVRFDGIDTHIPAPWAVLRYLPILGLARSPGRFFVVAMLGISVVFALSLCALAAQPHRNRRSIFAGAAVLLFAELWPVPRTIFSAEIPSIYQIVASDSRPDVRVLELPFGLRDGTMAVGNFTSRTQYYQTAHTKPILGGYLSRVSRRRIRENESDPVLGALIRLSEGAQLTHGELQKMRSAWPGFAERTSIGYIVLDRRRTPDSLRLATLETLPLEELASDSELTLYRALQPAPSGH